MANAQLISELATGIRDTSGNAVAGGKAYVYLPDTLTQTTVFSDEGATVGLTQPLTLNSAGQYIGARVTGPVRLLVQTAASPAVTVLDQLIAIQRDANVAITSVAFTGGDVKTALDTALTAFGGQDFNYKPSAGGVNMTPKDWMNGVWRSVKAYGAKGDGATPDDTAIAAAIADVVSASGGTVYFPPGNYLCNSTIVVTSSLGVYLAGAGPNVTTLTNNSGSNNLISFSSASYSGASNMSLAATSSSTGAGISVGAACVYLKFDRVHIAGHLTGITHTGATIQSVLIQGCRVNVSGVGSRAVYYTVSGSSLHGWIANSDLSAETCVEYAGSMGRCWVTNTQINASTTGVKFASGLTGVDFTISGCPRLGSATTPIDLSALSADPVLRQWGNEVDGYTVNVAIAGNHTPNRALGSEIRIKANSGGAGTVTVNAPTPAPTSAMRDVKLTIKYVNASGGAVTWAFAASTFVHVGAAVPASTDLHTITVLYLWDPDAARWREVSRGDTLT